MARGFGERLAGAGQALQAFDAAYMQARERQERQRQLRDAQRLREEQAAQAALRLKYGPGAAPTAPSMAGLPVAGLAPVARTQAPAQRQAAPTTTAAPVTTAAPPAAAPATRLVGTMEPQQEIRPMELQYRQGLITQRPPYVNYTETQEQQLAGMRQRRATINQELRYIDEQLRQIPTGRALGTGDQVLRQTYEAQKARLMREREALVNQLRGVAEDTSTRRFISGAPGLSVPVPSTSALAVPFQTQPGQMTTPELVLREEPAAAPATTAPPKQQKAQEELVQAAQSVPMGEGPAPQKLADTVANATSGVMYGRGAEAFDPQAASVATQQALQLRQTILAQYNALREYGFGFRAAELIPQIQAIDLGLYKAQGEQGVYEGITTGNYSRAVTVLSQMQGIPHQVLDRGDGTYDLYVNGRVSETAQTPAALADYFRYQIDEGYRARKAEIASAEYQQQAKINEIITKAVLDAQGNMQVALLNAQAELAKEEIKGAKPELTLDTGSGVMYISIGDQVSIVDPRGQIMKIAGEEVTLPTTTRVPGFGG